MNKKLLTLLLAGLLVASITACTKPGDNETTTDDTSVLTPEDSYIVNGTDAEGNDITEIVTQAPADTSFDPSETNPTFTDVTKKVVILAEVAKVRTSTVMIDNNVVGWPKEGKLLDVTGESENWYRITYTVNDKEETCYIAKTVAADVSVLDGFKDVAEEEVEVIADSLNVRSYPSADHSYAVRGTLKKGAKVTRVAVSEGWSRILFEMTYETETDAEGNPKTEIKQYYIKNEYIKAPEATTEAATEAVTDAATEATTAAATEAATEAAN
jgi:hypothetical protein